MQCVGPTFSEAELGELRDEYSFTPDIDELAAGMALFSHPTRLKIFALLDEAEEMCVCDLAAVLGITVSAVSQNLAKFRAHRMVQYRRDAQTLYYGLTKHPLNSVIRQAVRGAREAVSE